AAPGEDPLQIEEAVIDLYIEVRGRHAAAIEVDRLAERLGVDLLVRGRELHPDGVAAGGEGAARIAEVRDAAGAVLADEGVAEGGLDVGAGAGAGPQRRRGGVGPTGGRLVAALQVPRDVEVRGVAVVVTAVVDDDAGGELRGSGEDERERD